jgi:hypothetical protein
MLILVAGTTHSRCYFSWVHGENDCIIIISLQLSSHVLEANKPFEQGEKSIILTLSI